jgi:DNA-binding transcriptional regulator YdaS (Cro superfamily)
MKLKITELIEFFGTQEKTAKALGASQVTVSGWLNGLHGMHPVTAMKAEKLTGGKILAVDLCPRLKELDSAA